MITYSHFFENYLYLEAVIVNKRLKRIIFVTVSGIFYLDFSNNYRDCKKNMILDLILMACIFLNSLYTEEVCDDFSN